MNPLPFNLGNAMFHFNRTGGPSGFIWRYVVFYAGAALAIQLVTLPLMAPIWAVSLNPELAADPVAANNVMIESLGQIMLGYLLSFVLGVLLWMVFEAANQRRHVRGEGFKLRFGADEGRLLVVGLIWVALVIALYIAAILLVMIPTALAALASGSNSGNAAVAVVIALIMGLLVFALGLWIAARFSAAAALTIRDQQIRFFESWRVTKGKTWTLIGAWLLLGLIAFLLISFLYIVFAGVAAATLFSTLSAGAEPELVLEAFSSPPAIAGFAVFIFLISMLSAGLGHVFAGPAALAAKTDPSWAGRGGLAETFG